MQITSSKWRKKEGPVDAEEILDCFFLVSHFRSFWLIGRYEDEYLA